MFCDTLCTLCVCVCVSVFELGLHAATVWDYDSRCLLITQATAFLMFADGYFALFDYAAPCNCQYIHFQVRPHLDIHIIIHFKSGFHSHMSSLLIHHMYNQPLCGGMPQIITKQSHRMQLPDCVFNLAWLFILLIYLICILKVLVKDKFVHILHTVICSARMHMN